MAKIEKHYKLTQSEIDYIEFVKEKNNLTLFNRSFKFDY